MTLPLVLLPGMMCDARLFGPQIAALSPDRPVIVADLARHDSIRDMAAAVLAGLPGRFALAGLSMGGIVAMEMLARAPGRIARLALLDTNPFAETPAMRARRAPQIDAVRQGRLAAIMRDEMKPNYLADGPHRAEILDLCMTMALDLGPDVFVRQSRALADRDDLTAALAAYPGPALVLCGAEDRLCPVARHLAMKALMPQAALEILSGAGHLPTLERPRATTALLRRWLADTARGA